MMVKIAAKIGAEYLPAPKFARKILYLFILFHASPLGSAEEGIPKTGMDTTKHIAWVEGHARYDQRPLTVEILARLKDPAHFNILIAHELKSSPAHWEIFTCAPDGALCVYLPGHDPDHIRSSFQATDGQWHLFRMILTQDEGILEVDGHEVARERIHAKVPFEAQAGDLAIGSLVSMQLGCHGDIAEVRILGDRGTLGSWDLGSCQDDRFEDRSSHGNHAKRLPAPQTMDRLDITSLNSEEAAELDISQPLPEGKSIALLPPQIPVEETRKALKRARQSLPLNSLKSAPEPRDGVLKDWEEQFFFLDLRLQGKEMAPPGAEEQVYDRHALCWPQDRDPLGVVLRQTQALHQRLSHDMGQPGLETLGRDLDRLILRAKETPLNKTRSRKDLFLLVCALQREIAFSNPLLDFDSILFVARGNPMGSRFTGPTVTKDVFGQHFATQYFAFNSLPGGGLFEVSDYKTEPRVRDLLRDVRVENGRLRGRELKPGAFLSPDLSFDGQEIVFAYTENREHRWKWTPETSWNLFRMKRDGTGLTQITDSEYGDFDPCWLPDGKIAFISNRRGGFIRCFALLHVPNYVLHIMDRDGRGIRPLSFYETSEWHPSVNHDGMLVYTRWDYTDRENCLGSNFWITYPDGRNPRAPHGNYPYPWHTFPDNDSRDTRFGRPYTEMNIRAIPGSRKYILTAAPHHGEAFGSLAILDLSDRDDGFMGQLRRLTPYAPFPETEIQARSQYPFGTPWPLSEDFFLCNYWENLYLLDRFGNLILLAENPLCFHGQFCPEFRLIDPIPFKARPTPPILPDFTAWDTSNPNPSPSATVAVMNVYDSDLPLPKGTKIRWIRVVQNILKENPWMGVPMIGYQEENTPRIPLGIAPVEEDGSAFFEVPAGKELIFQILDDRHMAVQTMRSVAYAHPGEKLTCMGCHEDTHSAPLLQRSPTALERPPSSLRPELGDIEPVGYYRTVKPILDATCKGCHEKKGKGPLDLSYEALRPLVFYFAGGMSGSTIQPIHGGSRSIPGRCGANASELAQILTSSPHKDRVSDKEILAITLWLDCNAPRLTAFHDMDRQIEGDLVWPRLDVSP